MSKKTKFDPEKFAKDLAKRNKKFKEATRDEKRIMILKDALALTRTPKFKLTRGIYGYLHNIDQDKPFQESLVIPGAYVSCDVCARGAMFCSRVRLGNDIEVKTYLGGDDTTKALRGIFTLNELRIIEDVFEQKYVAWEHASKEVRNYFGGNRKDYYTNIRKFFASKYLGRAGERFAQTVRNILWAKGDVEKGIFRALYSKGELTSKTAE